MCSLAKARPNAAPTDPKATPHEGQGSSPKSRSDRTLIGDSRVWPTSSKLIDIFVFEGSTDSSRPAENVNDFFFFHPLRFNYGNEEKKNSWPIKYAPNSGCRRRGWSIRLGRRIVEQSRPALSRNAAHLCMLSNFSEPQSVLLVLSRDIVSVR